MSAKKKDRPRGPAGPHETRRRTTWPWRAYPNDSALGIHDDNWLARWKRKSAARRKPDDELPK